MSRFLFVMPPLAGHVNPTIAVGQELDRRGHRTAWTGHGRLVAQLLPPDARLFPAGGTTPWYDEPEEEARAQHARWLNLRGLAGIKFFWEETMIPLARTMLRGVEDAVDAFRPDVLVVDQQALAGAAVARRRGLPWATSATTSAELIRPYALLPKVEAWVRELLEAFQRDYGIDAATARRGDLRFSDQLVLAFTTPELMGSFDAPGSPVFVGPALGSRPHDVDFPWGWLDPGPPGARRRRVLVSLGTLNGEAGGQFYPVALEAFAARADSLQVILAAPPGTVDAVPDNVVVRGFVPQLELLPHLDAVLSHGGHNTVCEALAHGLPLVVAPIRDDQSIVAGQVVATGAGVRVKFGRVRPPELRGALDAVLGDPAYAAAARRIAASFASAGGAAAAADHLERLARASPAGPPLRLAALVLQQQPSSPGTSRVSRS